ncbi:MAG: flagella basal body P-ring formation protein FlgA [Deltaproteobacteria bacterium]|nr:MAG: flagella basal body P-ring formation protein FlgA [Deltaproteobacteria bacterium]
MRTILSVLILFVLTGTVWGMTVVMVPPEARVEGDWIRLGDIATIQGDDPLKVKELRGVVLGRSPLPGTCRYLRRSQIQASIRGVDLFCPPRVKVVRASQVICPEKIRELATAYIRERLSFAEKVEISCVRIRGKVILPQGPWRYLVLNPSGRLLGRVSLVLLFKAKGREAKALVFAEVHAWAKVVVAKKKIRPYHLIEEGDLMMEERDLAGLAGFITDLREVVGKRSKGVIPMGAPIRWDQIEVPPVVKKGKVVRIVLETPWIRATALGAALENGRRGERIRVMNLSSRREIIAEVLDRSTVKAIY